jgi:S1-C subfamily serine protease
MDFWENRTGEVPEGSGSGFLWDDRGHVVTNFHVVRGGEIFRVRFRDGAVFEARLLGVARDYDLAVIEIDAPRERLQPLPVGRSADLRVGQQSYAIGYPFGLEQTLTTGVISGLDRAIQSQARLLIHGVVQTDAAINPGNSGGPLLDSAGRLIGVNTAIATPSGANTGVGFAVPVDTVNRIVPRILAEGEVERAGLGIVIGHDGLARDHGIEGAVVERVIPSGPAGRAGLRGIGTEEELGDVITGVNDLEILGEADLYEALEPYRAGEEVLVRLNRPDHGSRTSEEVRIRLEALR